MHSEPLNIKDKTFLVNRLIQQAPVGTLIREFMKNAEESAATADVGARRILIYPTFIDGVRKLSFWNTGQGMSAAELKTATDLSSSINKAMALDGNFGIGAKVSGLAASPHGIRYRSCKEGHVSEVTIGYEEDAGTYVRFAGMLPDGKFDTVFDVTRICGRDTSFDWTEVVLMGESESHDTVAYPLGRDKYLDRSFIPTAIFRRFARFAPGVEVMIDTAMTKGGGKDETGRNRSLKTLEEVLPRLPKWESVSDQATAIKVRYIHDPKHPTGHSASARANPATGSTTFCALVHKGERYDFKTQKAWSAASPNFGVPFGSKVLTIEIELPDGFALPNQYRDGLTWPADREAMRAEEFGPLVRELMPEWVRDVVRAESPQRDDKLDDLKEDLQRVLDEFRLPTHTLSPSSTDASQPSEDSKEGLPQPERASTEFAEELQRSLNEVATRAGRKASDKRVRLAPAGAQPSELARALERAPEIQILYTEDEVVEKGIGGRSGKFYKDIQTLFINGLYSAVDRMAWELQREFPDGADPDQTRALVVKAAQRWTAFRVGKATCYALAKRILDDWTTDDLDTATSPESLSLAADDYRQSLPAAKKWVIERLKMIDLAEVA